MLARRWVLAVAVACANGAVVQRAFAEDAAPLIEPLAATELQLDNADRSGDGKAPPLPDVVIPIRRKADVMGLSAAVMRVTVAGQSRPSLVAAFTPPDGELGQALTFKIAFARLRRPATYGVTVLLTGKVPPKAGDAPAEVKQIVELAFVLPPAKLRALAPIVIRDSWYPFGDGVRHTLHLEEVGGTTRISGLVVKQNDPARWDGADSEARLERVLATTSTTHADAITADGDLPIELSGSGFDVGTTTGNLTIRGDGLEAPVVVPFEVRRKVVDFAIVAVFLLAGVAGWLMRHYLENAEARAELRAKLEPLYDSAARQIDSHPDAGTRSKLRELRDSVQTAVQSDDLTLVQTKANELQAALDAAVVARGQLVADRLKHAAELKRALAGSWDLPGAVDLAAVGASIKGAEDRLVAGDLAGADVQLDDAQKTIDRVGQDANTWKNGTRPIVAGFKVVPADEAMPIPATVREEAGPAAQKAAASLVAVPNYDPKKAPPLEAFLAAVHQARQDLRVLVGIVAPAFEREVKVAVAALAKSERTDQNPKGVASQDERKAIADSAELPALDGDPAAALDALAGAIRAFARELGKVLRPETKKFLTGGEYATAVAEEAQAKANQDLKSQISATRKSVTDEAPPSKPEARSVDLPAADPRSLLALRTIDPVVLARVELKKIRKIRGVVTALLLAWVAWAFYRDTWTGTVKDFFGVATVAFFTDFTIDALLDAIGKLKK